MAMMFPVKSKLFDREPVVLSFTKIPTDEDIARYAAERMLKGKKEAYMPATFPHPVIQATGEPIAHVVDCRIDSSVDDIARMSFTVYLM